MDFAPQPTPRPTAGEWYADLLQQLDDTLTAQDACPEASPVSLARDDALDELKLDVHLLEDRYNLLYQHMADLDHKILTTMLPKSPDV